MGGCCHANGFDKSGGIRTEVSHILFQTIADTPALRHGGLPWRVYKHIIDVIAEGRQYLRLMVQASAGTGCRLHVRIVHFVALYATCTGAACARARNSIANLRM